MPAKVFLKDGGRHRLPTGYGSLARSIIIALLNCDEFELTIQNISQKDIKEDLIDFDFKKLEGLYQNASSSHEIILQLGPIDTFSVFNQTKQAVIGISCIDVSDLTNDQKAYMERVDAMIAFNSENHHIFEKYKPSFLAQGGVFNSFYKPQDRRNEGAKEFTFISVGSFCFRKGSDILINAFLEEFASTEAHLHLHIQPHQTESCANFILERAYALGKVPNIKITSKSVSDDWLSRFINRADCFVLPSRGEGWCLPLNEAMLCSKAVIATRVTAMRDYIPETHQFIIESKQKDASTIESNFGAGFRAKYGSQNIMYYEPSLNDLRKKMRIAKELGETKLNAIGEEGREIIQGNFLSEHLQKRFISCLKNFQTEKSKST